MSDQARIYLYKSRQVMRMQKYISLRIISWSNTKFLELLMKLKVKRITKCWSITVKSDDYCGPEFFHKITLANWIPSFLGIPRNS